MRLFDTHCHVQMPQYDEDREAAIGRALGADTGMIIVGTTIADSLEAVNLAERHAGRPVYAAVGVHPTDEDLSSVHPAQLQALLGSAAIVAIGECGLDYYHVDEPEAQDLQADMFEQHILLAQQAGLPLIIHCRDKKDVFDAYEHTLTLLQRHRVSRFVMHCYSGTWDLAQRFLGLGGCLSFTGIVTYPNADMIQEVVRKMPLDRMMVETDAPFLAPQSVRGQRNEPVRVAEVVEKIAELRGSTAAAVAAATTANAVKFFRLPG